MINASDIVFFLSAPQAGAGYTATGNPGNSLGKYMATNAVNPVTPVDNLFTDITTVENAADQVDYQCMFVMNNTQTGLTARAPYAWFPTALWSPQGAGLALAVDPTLGVLYNQSAAQAVNINNPLQFPPGVGTFNAGPHSQFTNGIVLPDLPPLYCVAIWIRRTATGGPPVTPQTATVTVTFQSAA